MATGRIMTILADKGYGFIKDTPGPNGTNNVFFHRSAVTGVTVEELREGQDVSFDAGQDPRDATRVRANNVRPLHAAAEATPGETENSDAK